MACPLRLVDVAAHTSVSVGTAAGDMFCKVTLGLTSAAAREDAGLAAASSAAADRVEALNVHEHRVTWV